ncbi:MAG TPA: hypothetical protein VE078_07360 [Thermoanaerobaculia bacterium]|nr:hypothetical protein [Thermoanaerobaculia bacterium]
MRKHQLLSLSLLALLPLLFALPTQAVLTPVGSPLVIAEQPFCTFETEVEVIATPAGAFEVVWPFDVHFPDNTICEVRGLRFARNLQPTGPPRALLPVHGGLEFSSLVGTWAGRYELVMNADDYGNNPGDPPAAYRVSLDLEGDPLAPPARFKPTRFIELAPAAGGDSLQFRFEPPFFGPPGCQSRGLLARRIGPTGAPLSAESRVNRRASAWSDFRLAVDRLPNDTFVAAYSTCQKFVGLVARRLNAAGAPVGKPINLPLPGRVANSGARAISVAARGTDFAVAAYVDGPTVRAYTVGVVNGQVFGPTPIGAVVDLEASPSGGYLLLFRAASGDPSHPTLFAQELDARGVPQGTPLAISGEEGSAGVEGAIASLPNGRWIVITRAQQGDPGACSERVVGTILAATP